MNGNILISVSVIAACAFGEIALWFQTYKNTALVTLFTCLIAVNITYIAAAVYPWLISIL
jgi:hypothetical protein